MKPSSQLSLFFCQITYGQFLFRKKVNKLSLIFWEDSQSMTVFSIKGKFYEFFREIKCGQFSSRRNAFLGIFSDFWSANWLSLLGLFTQSARSFEWFRSSGLHFYLASKKSSRKCWPILVIVFDFERRMDASVSNNIIMCDFYLSNFRFNIFFIVFLHVINESSKFNLRTSILNLFADTFKVSIFIFFPFMFEKNTRRNDDVRKESKYQRCKLRRSRSTWDFTLHIRQFWSDGAKEARA